MIYRISEKFKSLQGEGQFTGTPMAFIRFVGCSVGKKVCNACDTDFEQEHSWRGGGEFTALDLSIWAHPYKHVCLTGGEPLDQNLDSLVHELHEAGVMIHIETSGTKLLNNWLHALRPALWVCVSPKPGFLEHVVMGAEEIKVIVPGLGTMTSAAVDARIRSLKGEGYQCGPGEFEDYARAFRWPTLVDAERWAAAGKLVYLQPRNGRFDIDPVNLKYVIDLLQQYPQFRLSGQLHKILKVQ